MQKVLNTMAGLAAIVALTLAAPSAAEAQCRDCPRPDVTTSHQTKTVRPVTRSTRYRDVVNTRHITHTKRIVTITRVQPVTRVNVVTRVHYKTRFINKRQNIARTKRHPAQTVATNRTRIVSNATGRNRVQTVYRYKTLRQVRNVTRYRDVYRVRHVVRSKPRGCLLSIASLWLHDKHWR